MRKNKRKQTFHVSTRVRGAERPRGAAKFVLIGVLVLIVGSVLAALAIGCLRLRDVWIEQCILTDPERQIHIETGSHIKPGVIRGCFGLRKGVNLATIDFSAKRLETLEKIPNIKHLTIVRRQPDQIFITVVEREPVARMNVKNNRTTTGRVVDEEGIVFIRQANTDLLPTIVEAPENVSPKGHKVSGRTMAALRLAKLFQTEKFADLALRSIYTTYPDYLLASLELESGTTLVKIAWDGMDNPISNSDALMEETATNLRSAIRTRYGDKARVWTALEPTRIYADTKEPIQ